MKPSLGDYRPAARRRYVPSGGTPPRRIPVIRVVLLLALGALAYARFDDYWPRVRQAFAFLSPGDEASPRGSQGAAPDAPKARWSSDSAAFALDCPRGLDGACCERLAAASPDLCAETKALLARARWWGRSVPQAGFLKVEARADESARLALAGISGRDGRGFVLRRRETGDWCDGQGCLGRRTAPVPPLADAVLEAAGPGVAIWVSGMRWARAALPGRVSSVDSGAEGIRVRVYHGLELYTDYGPLRELAGGVRPGAVVKAGSHLGDAPARGARHALTVRVRQAGRPLDAATFWNARVAASPFPEDEGDAP